MRNPRIFGKPYAAEEAFSKVVTLRDHSGLRRCCYADSVWDQLTNSLKNPNFPYQRTQAPAEMILIGSGALLWHAAQVGIETPLPENSMDVDPVTESEEVALLGYEAIIGSDFEKKHGWHVNLMPMAVLKEFPPDWKTRAKQKSYGLLTVLVPCAADLLISKLKRGEPRDKIHAEWARQLL